MVYFSQQATMNKGELSPLLGSRSDIDFWQSSLKECTNFQVLVQGGIRRRSGTVFLTEVANSAEPVRLEPFVFSSTQAYILVFNNGKIRFLADRATVTDGGGGLYQIDHPWSSTALASLSTAQANDVMYVAHKSYEPREIKRNGDNNWGIASVVMKDGPYLDQEEARASLSPGDRGSLTPFMTTNTAPFGSASDSAGSANAYKAFDGNGESGLVLNATSGWVAYNSPSPQVADAYWVTAQDSSPIRTPSNWTFEGFDGSDWVVLDTRTAENGWVAGETRFFQFSNTTAFSAYRLNWRAASGAESTSGLGELGINVSGDTQAPFIINATSTIGINNGAGFQPSDVGRTLRLLGSDNRYRWARITQVLNATQIRVRMYGFALPNFARISSWRMGAFSTTSGWPGSVVIYDERLMWARTDTQPTTVFGSKQAIFDDYGVSDPAVETDGLSLTLLSSNMNEILWLADNEDLIAGTSQQLRAIGPADTTRAFSATNLAQRKGPTNGASGTNPISIGEVLLYIGAGDKKIREMVIGESGRYVAPDLSVVGEHMLKSGIVAWDSTVNPDPMVYLVNGDGQLIVVTYDRDQRVVAFARHEIAGGFIEDVAIIPGIEAGYDDVYLVVRRTINGALKRYIEVLERPFDPEKDQVTDSFFVDCGLKYSGAPITTVTGLGHLEGESVVALAEGNVVNGLTVTGGAVTLPYEASEISIGLSFTSKAITLPVAGPQQDGSLFGRRVNVIAPSVDVLKSGSLKVSAWSDEWTPEVYEQLLRRGDELFGSSVDLVTGFQPCQIEGSWADHGSFVMQTDEPLPLLIRSFVMQLENEP